MMRVLLIAGLVLSVLLACGMGAMHIPLLRVVAILLYKLHLHLPISFTESEANVLWQIRLPRVCMGVMVGGSLAMAGAAIQGLFRNPLADPGLVGISAGAALFAVLCIVVFSGVSYYWMNVATFLGAVLSALLVFRLSRSGGSTHMATLLLAGLGINALCNALTGLITYMANNDQLRSVTFWTMGSLGGATWATVAALLPFVVVPVLLLPRLAKWLNAFALGEAAAAHLGIPVKRLKAGVMLLATLLVGACVAVSGIIGFVGLIVPHILRSASGSDHRALLPNSFLLGASLLTLSDVLSRTLIAPAELPLGIVTAILGTPLFIGMLMKQKRQLNTWAS
ncbi:iron complex transport system permease protein [Chitinophaga costaii]|uniref:Iron complex transport system permease protein n=2 Tax=Chitinophaga costaii TaxID=1335309 RepID=A0A1C4EEV6_9BACT|nr:iron complex transport system permease protein [Chitinophaga costaii]